MKCFAEKCFHFLAQFNPYALTRADSYGRLPLHYTAFNKTSFQVVFEYRIRYYPNKKGISLLFEKNKNRWTPFFMACVTSALQFKKDKHLGKNCGRDKVMNVIEETLLDCQRRSDDNNNNSSSNSNSIITGPYNIANLLVTAAIDEGVHLECVYFLLRRHPDVLIQLLSSTSAAVAGSNNNNNNNNHNGSDGGDEENDHRVRTDITSATASNNIIDADSELSVKQQQEDNIIENEGRVSYITTISGLIFIHFFFRHVSQII